MMTWKVQACPKRLLSSGINGEGEIRGQLANPGSPGKWPLKWSVCVRACTTCCNIVVVMSWTSWSFQLSMVQGSPHIFYSCGEDGVVYQIDLRQEKPNK